MVLGFFYEIFRSSPHIPIALVVLAPAGQLLLLCFQIGVTSYRLLSIKPLVGLGLISYSAYLWHQPLLAFYKNMFIGRTDDVVLLLLCLITNSCLSWRFLVRDRSRFIRLQATVCAFFFVIGIFVWSNLQIENPNIDPSSFTAYASKKILLLECGRFSSINTLRWEER